MQVVPALDEFVGTYDLRSALSVAPWILHGPRGVQKCRVPRAAAHYQLFTNCLDMGLVSALQVRKAP